MYLTVTDVALPSNPSLNPLRALSDTDNSPGSPPEKPVTLAIDEVADGKFDASTIDSSIQE